MNTIWDLTLKMWQEEKLLEPHYIYDANGKSITKKTRAEILKAAIGFSAYLKKEKGRHVGIYMDNSANWLSAFIGTVISGNAAVLLDKRLPDTTIVKYADKADVDLVVYDSMSSELKEKLEHTISIEAVTEAEDVNCIEEFVSETRGEDLCAILFTSGTTGEEKCVMLSQKNITFNVEESILLTGYTREDSFLGILPSAHAFGMTQSLLAAFFNGGEIVYSSKVLEMIPLMQKFEPVYTMMIPMMVKFLCQKMTATSQKNPGIPKREIANQILGKNIRYISVGGAAINEDIVKEMEQFGIIVRPGYGMTEASPLITGNMVGAPKAGSVGVLLPGTEMKFVDGEIYVKSPSVMMGYYKNEEATGEAIKDGWLRTGDIGYMDEDGYVFLTGRKKNLIILSNGENISPEYIETILQGSTFITEACIQEKNDRIMAEIVPAKELAAETPETIHNIIWGEIEKINQELPFYSKIMDIVICKEELKKNIYGKMIRQ